MTSLHWKLLIFQEDEASEWQFKCVLREYVYSSVLFSIEKAAISIESRSILVRHGTRGRHFTTVFGSILWHPGPGIMLSSKTPASTQCRCWAGTGVNSLPRFPSISLYNPSVWPHLPLFYSISTLFYSISTLFYPRVSFWLDYPSLFRVFGDASGKTSEVKGPGAVGEWFSIEKRWPHFRMMTSF